MKGINWAKALSAGTVSKAWCKFRDTVTVLEERPLPLRPRRAPYKPGVANKRSDDGTKEEEKIVEESKVWTRGAEELQGSGKAGGTCRAESKEEF